MKTYAQTLVSEEELRLFRYVQVLLEELPDVDLGEDLEGHPFLMSCHILVRALVQHIGADKVKFVDGRLYPFFDHSWLVTLAGNIIDVYPVATIGGPIMILAENSQAAHHYLTNVPPPIQRSYEKRFNLECFQRAVELTVMSLAESTVIFIPEV
ncbi:MAG: hypothetical protein Q8L01_01940 [Candidatus Woesebacteria bacterium]|nr:hypothetical protein [Candidatus Woesebacteria bacterium]